QLFGIASGCMSIDSNRMTAERFGRFHPFEMILNRQLPFGCVSASNRTLLIAHDQQYLYAVIVGAALELGEVLPVLGFIHEELVYQLDRIETVVLFRNNRKIHVLQTAVEQRAVKRPFSQRNLKRKPWRHAASLQLDRMHTQGACQDRALPQKRAA